MAVSKVQKSDGTVIMDISQDNVNANNLLQGGTAHGSDGEAVQGAVIIAPTDVTEVSDTTPYIYKSSEHDAVYDELVGGSVAWNQLVQNGNFASTSGWGGVQATISAVNNTLTLVVVGSQAYTGIQRAITQILANHVILASYDYDASSISNFWRTLIQLRTGSTYTAYGSKTESKGTNSFLFKHTSTPDAIQIIFNKNTNFTSTDTITVKNFYCVDLTQMFGPTIADYAYNLEQSTAGSGIAWLKSYGFLTKDYYPYNTSTLMSVNVSGKRVVGKNLVEETIVHSNVTASGSIQDTENTSFDVHICKVQKDQQYFLTTGNTGGEGFVYSFFLNEPTRGTASYNGVRYVTAPTPITAPITGYMAFRTAASYATPQCELGSTATNYEPYTSITYPIQSTDLRGLYKLNGNKLYTDGDIYSADGTVTRKYGIVDLGTLDWTYPGGDNNYFRADIPNIKTPNNDSVFNAINPRYIVVTWSSWYSNRINKTCGFGNDSRMYVTDTSYTDAATFKTAMSGVYLIYELATPTTETAQPFTSPQMVYRQGTEEFIDTRDVPMPVGGNRKYVDIPEWMVNEYFDDCRTQLERAISDPETFCDSINALQTTGGTMTGDLIMNVGTTIKSNNGKNRLSVDNTQSYLYSTGIGSNTGLVDVWLSGNQPEILIRCEDSANNQYKYISLSLYSFRIKSNAIRWDGDNSALPTGTGTNLVIDSDGYFKKASSSRNVKHDIEYVKDTNDYHDALMQMKPATFIYNSDKTETQKLGMIAEDVADVCPIAGMTDKDGKVENYDDRAIITMLVAEVQRLNAEIDKLKGR